MQSSAFQPSSYQQPQSMQCENQEMDFCNQNNNTSLANDAPVYFNQGYNQAFMNPQPLVPYINQGLFVQPSSNQDNYQQQQYQ